MANQPQIQGDSDNTILIVVVLFVIICMICLCISIITGAGAYYFWPTIIGDDTPITTPPTTTPPTTTPPTTTPPTTTPPTTTPPTTTPPTTTPPTTTTPPVIDPPYVEPTAPCGAGYPDGAKPPLPFAGNTTLLQIIGRTSARYFKLPGTPYNEIKLKNWQLGNHTIDVYLDGVNTGCKTLEVTPDNKVVVKKAYDNNDYTYSYENDEIYIEMNTGKHQVTGL